jgi:hypothetical protein
MLEPGVAGELPFRPESMLPNRRMDPLKDPLIRRMLMMQSQPGERTCNVTKERKNPNPIVKALRIIDFVNRELHPNNAPI